MDFRVDRLLPMPVRQQLKGTIAFGIAFGELVVGSTLPSVREMATLAGIAPMTVSLVYAELKREGLIETRLGAGTFIADSSQARAAQRSDLDVLHRQIDAMISKGELLNIELADLAAMINARIAYRQRPGRRVRIVMVGLFPEATASYADFIASRLGRGVAVEPMTLDQLRAQPDLRVQACSADFVVTFSNRHGEVLDLLPTARVVTLRFIPSERTRMWLASIDPTARVVVLSRFPDFLPIFRSGVQRFAPHVPRVTAINFDDPNAARHLEDCDVVVYATGTETTAELAEPAVHKFEYRHIPDPADIDRVLKPLIEGLAAAPTQLKEIA